MDPISVKQEMSSHSTAKLFEALSKAQMEITGAAKTKKNPHFKCDYADLNSTWEACREPLGANGLTVVQTVEQLAEKFVLVTTLGHTSGEWMKSVIPLINTKMDMQGLGSALTYARRYGLASMCGVCPSDDDGNAATYVDSIQLADLCDVLSQDENPRELYSVILKQTGVPSFSRIPAAKFDPMIKWVRERQKVQQQPKTV